MAARKNRKKRSVRSSKGNIDSIELEYSSDLVEKLKSLSSAATVESLSEILSILKLANSKVIAQDVKKLIDKLKNDEDSFEEFSKQISDIRQSGINKNLNILNKLQQQYKIEDSLYKDLTKTEENSYKKIQSHQELIVRIKSKENTLYERFFETDKKIGDQIQDNYNKYNNDLKKRNKDLKDKREKLKKELNNNVKFLAELDELRSSAEALAESPFKDILSMAETFIERGDDYAKDISDYIKLSVKQPFKEIGLTVKAVPQLFKLGKSVFKNLFKKSPEKGKSVVEKEKKQTKSIAETFVGNKNESVQYKQISTKENPEIGLANFTIGSAQITINNLDSVIFSKQKETAERQTASYEIINSLPDNRKLLQTSTTNIDTETPKANPILPGLVTPTLDKQIKPAQLALSSSKFSIKQPTSDTDFKQDDTEIIKLQQEDVYYKEKAISDNDKNFKTIISLLMINNDLQKLNTEKSKTETVETGGMMPGFASLFKNLFSIKIMDNLFRKFGGTKLAKGLSKLITPLNTKLRKSSFGQNLLRKTIIGKQLRKLEAAPVYNKFGPKAMRGTTVANTVVKTGIVSSSKTLGSTMKSIKAAAPALKGLGGLGRSIPLVGSVLAVAPDAIEAVSALKKGDMKTASKAAGSAGGGLAGAALGLKAGATIGTFVGGPIGMAIGGAIGTAVGGIAGSKLGSVLGKSIYSIGKGILPISKKAFSGILSISKKTFNGIKSIGSKALSIGKKALGFTPLGLGKKLFNKVKTVKEKIPSALKNKIKGAKDLITDKKDNLIKSISKDKTDKTPKETNQNEEFDFKKLLEVLRKIEYNTGNMRSQIIQTSIANYENF